MLQGLSRWFAPAASELRYRRLFESAKDGILILNADSGKIVDVNPFLTELLGYSHSEFIGKELWEIGLFKDILANRDAFLKLQTERYVRYENLPLETRTGRAIWVEFVSNVYVVGDENVIQCNIRDITERKHVEELLRESEDKFKSLYNNAEVAMFRTKLDGSGFITVNDKMCDILGYKREELIGRPTFLNWANPSEREEMVRRLQAEGQVKDFEWKLLTKSGEVRHCLTSLRLYRAEGILEGSFIDITQRKQAEDALRELSSRHEAILHTVPDIIAQVDLSKVYTWVNRAGKEFFGDDVVGKEAAFFFVGDQKTYTTVQPLFEGSPDIFYVESWQRRHDGEKRLLGWWCHSLKDQSGRVIGALSSARDITESHRAEEGLRQAEAKYRAIFENSMDGIFQSSPSGRFITVNPAFARMFGYGSPEEMLAVVTDIGQQLYFEPSRRDEFVRSMSEQDAFTGFEFQARRKDGSVLWVSENVRTIRDDEGKILYYEGLAEDITDRKRTEQELVYRAEQFSLLNQTSREITRPFLLNELLQEIVERATRLVRADCGMLYLSDEETKALNCVVDFNMARKYVGTTLRFGEGIAGQTALSGQPMLIPDYRVWEPKAEIFRDEPGWTIISVPLIWRGQVIGVLQVTDLSDRVYTSLEQELVMLFANQAAIAIQNARLLESERTARAQLQMASRKLVDSQEAERRAIAQELHDRIGQNLTGLGLNLNILRRQFEPHATVEVNARFEDSLTLVNQTIQQVRSVMADLRPSVLDDYGLLAALKGYCEAFALRSGIKFELRGETELRLPARVEIALFRIAQEALTNIAKHAQAGVVVMLLEKTNQHVRFVIDDDGVGFDPDTRKSSPTFNGLGLISMRERAESVGGTWRVESSAGKGTRILVEIPEPAIQESDNLS